VINILIPLNKNVTDIYKYYPMFITKIRNILIAKDINVIITVFSSLLLKELKNYTLIDGKQNSDENKSIREIEKEYEFSFKQILYTDKLQTSEFVSKTRGRNWYIPEKDFIIKNEYVNKLNAIIKLIENQKITHVITDQTTDFEHSFIMYVCRKKNIPFVRYLPNFMNRGYFVHYKQNEEIKIIDELLSEIKTSDIVKFVDDYKKGNQKTIYALYTDYSLYDSKKPLYKKFKDKKINDYLNFISRNFKDIYHCKIERILKKKYYRKFNKNIKYIYYGIGLTTESHVALHAYPYINQINLIETISRALPFGYILYTKPHPWWEDNISLNDLKRIYELPSVRILAPQENAKEIIKHSNGVVTINGTDGVEGLALGRSVIALAGINSFTDFHKNAMFCSNLYHLPKLIVNMVNDKVNNDDTIEYFTKMYKFSTDIPFEADKFISEEDANGKAKLFSKYLMQIINSYNWE